MVVLVHGLVEGTDAAETVLASALMSARMTGVMKAGFGLLAGCCAVEDTWRATVQRAAPCVRWQLPRPPQQQRLLGWWSESPRTL